MLRAVVQCSTKVCRSNVVLQTSVKGFATYKTSTGLVGLKVDPNGRENLAVAAEEILQSVKKIPEHSGYRQSVEQWFKFIKKVTAEKTEIKDIEDEIQLGQIEEVLEMCQSEKELIEYYYENKGWELVEECKESADAMIEEHADNIFFNSPESRRSYVKPEPAIAAPSNPAVTGGAAAAPPK